jgi:hypothetical protein
MDIPPDAAEAGRFDGPAMREEAERVLNKRVAPGFCDKWLRVTSVLWHGYTPHTEEDSWMALLDNGYVGLVARMPKDVTQKTLPCRGCAGAGERMGYSAAVMQDFLARQAPGEFPETDQMKPCPFCLGAKIETRTKAKDRGRIVGIFPELDSALASLPECYFTPEALRIAQRQWDARPVLAGPAR